MLTVQIGLPPGRYAEQPARSAFYARVFGALESADGVRSAGAAEVTPLTGNNWTAPLIRPEQPTLEGQRPPEVGWQLASGGYFKSLQIPLREGRLFDARDTLDSPPVVIVSDALAARFFPARTPSASGFASTMARPRSSAASATFAVPRSPTHRAPISTFRSSGRTPTA